MSPSPTGSLRNINGKHWLVLQRQLHRPVEQSWADFTESDHLRTWIGDWSGDARSGDVQFRMLYEGDDDPEPTALAIDACHSPEHLSVTLKHPSSAPWKLVLDLMDGVGGNAALTFAQPLDDLAEAAMIGPGWEYYLDRLEAVQRGEDPAAISFDDYYPALAEHYSA